MADPMESASLALLSKHLLSTGNAALVIPTHLLGSHRHVTENLVEITSLFSLLVPSNTLVILWDVWSVNCMFNDFLRFVVFG